MTRSSSLPMLNANGLFLDFAKLAALHFGPGQRDARSLGLSATRALISQIGERAGVACRRGCAHCCHQDTGASVPEVLDLAGYLRATARPLDALIAQVKARAAAIRATANKAARWQAQVPCGLLAADHSCIGHRYRPLGCCGYNSLDASACALGAGNVPVFADQAEAGAAGSAGLCVGVQAAGLDGAPLEVTLALEIALTVPDAEAQWRAGKPVFVPARLRQMEEWETFRANHLDRPSAGSVA